jgi:hypothetical protein
MSQPNVIAFAQTVVQTALQHLARSTGNSARICFNFAGRQWPTWINIDALVDESGPRCWARTNDIDLSIGSGPSFTITSTSLEEVEVAILAYLATDSGDSASVSTQLFLVTGHHQTILEGDSERGELAPKPEFISV